MEKMLRTRLLTALVLAVVFASGVLLGLAVDRLLDAEPAQVAEKGQEQDSASNRRVPMYEQVGPTEEQKILIDSIVKEYREDMKALHAEFRASYNPRYQALVDGVRASIKSVLDPEQAQAYDSLVAAYERRRAERDSREDRE